MTFENIQVGLKNSAESVVTENDTALAVESGSLKVLATPKLIALIEKAASDLAEKNLPAEYTSVGTLLNVKHTAPTPVGMKFFAEVEIIEVDRRRIVFKTIMKDERGEIGQGTHERFIVEREKFQTKANSK